MMNGLRFFLALIITSVVLGACGGEPEIVERVLAEPEVVVDTAPEETIPLEEVPEETPEEEVLEELASVEDEPELMVEEPLAAPLEEAAPVNTRLVVVDAKEAEDRLAKALGFEWVTPNKGTEKDDAKVASRAIGNDLSNAAVAKLAAAEKAQEEVGRAAREKQEQHMAKLVAEKEQAQAEAEEAKVAMEALAQAKLAGEVAAQERAEAAERTKVKDQAERVAREKEEAERLAQAKTESERLAKAKIEADRVAQEKAVAKARAEAERVARSQAEAERLAQAKAEAERVAQEKAAAEQLAREQAEAERLAQAKAEVERLEKAKAEAERLAQEKAMVVAQAQAEAERQAQVEAAEKEQAQAEALAQLKREAAALAQAKAEAETLAKARAESDRVAREEQAIYMAQLVAEKEQAEADAALAREAKERAEAQLKQAQAEQVRIVAAAEMARQRAEAEALAKAQVEAELLQAKSEAALKTAQASEARRPAAAEAKPAMKIAALPKARTSTAPLSPSGSLQLRDVVQGSVSGGVRGLTLNGVGTVGGLKGKKVELAAYFFDESGNPLKDTDKKFRSSRGQVYVGRETVLPSDTYNLNQGLFLPYTQLDIGGTTPKKLQVELVIWEYSQGRGRKLVATPRTSFTAALGGASTAAVASGSMLSGNWIADGIPLSIVKQGDQWVVRGIGGIVPFLIMSEKWTFSQGVLRGSLINKRNFPPMTRVWEFDLKLSADGKTLKGSYNRSDKNGNYAFESDVFTWVRSL